MTEQQPDTILPTEPVEPEETRPASEEPEGDDAPAPDADETGDPIEGGDATR